ncbi:MAG: retropepsin-like domain-containing protein [Planctomycetia bacterium]|nr:retropepsin-like domain-containing protein [Planctomycetia bacterium]
MAQLTFPIVADELLVDVRINLAAPDLAVLQAASQPAPASVMARAILDTGSNATGVAASIIQQFQLLPAQHSTTQGIGGAPAVDLFRVSLSICDASQLHLPRFTQPDLLVMELPPGFPVDVLIGMDVILDCRLLIDGPGRTFTIDF